MNSPESDDMYILLIQALYHCVQTETIKTCVKLLCSMQVYFCKNDRFSISRNKRFHSHLAIHRP